jgi:hypothetical protein
MTKPAVVYMSVLAILALACGLGRMQTRVVPIADFSFDALPTHLGPWQCVNRERPPRADKNTDEAVMETFTYQDASGVRASVILQVTSSRLGVLRDWSTAQVGQGWTAEDPQIVSARVPGSSQPVTFTGRWMAKSNLRTATMTWYASPRDQAESLARAEVLGWRDQMAGRALWGCMYVQASSDGAGDALWDAAADLAARIAPQFRSILQTNEAERLAAGR